MLCPQVRRLGNGDVGDLISKLAKKPLLFVVGGQDPDNCTVETVEAYDCDSKQWHDVHEMVREGSSHGPHCACATGCIPTDYTVERMLPLAALAVGIDKLSGVEGSKFLIALQALRPTCH